MKIFLKVSQIAIIVLCFLISASELHSQFTNYRIFPSGYSQIEPTICRHPTDPQLLFASAYTILLNSRSEGTYFSTNGGLNWTGNDVCTGIPIQNHGGDPGTVIDKNGVYILTHLGNIQTGMFANFTTNLGVNWSNNVTIQQADVDKGSPGTDDAPASPFYGRTYLAWTYFVPPIRIVLSYTTNSGANWSGIINVNNGLGGNRSFGPAICVNPTGTVFVTWASAIPNSPFSEDFIGVAKSTNGGINWNIVENAIDINGIRTTTLAPWTIRANSFPVIDIDKTGGSRNGWIYIATTSKNLAPAGTDPDIILYRSTNDGNTWTNGVRVNQDVINNGRNQFFPSVRVDENGGVNIIYYDSRNAVDSVDVYLSRSTNGGTNWADYKITTSRFRPQAVSGALGAGNMGDNLGLTSGNGKLYPVWMANYTGIFQVWSANIDYTTIGIQQIGNEIPKEFELKQNYPNPFNPVTKIRFATPLNPPFDKGGNVRSTGGFTFLSVYDILGREVATLVNEQLQPGVYEVNFDGTNLPSGIYFYVIRSGNFTDSKKMLMIK